MSTLTGVIAALTTVVLMFFISLSPFIAGASLSDPDENNWMAVGMLTQLGVFAIIWYYPVHLIAQTVFHTALTLGNAAGKFEHLYIPGLFFLAASYFLLKDRVSGELLTDTA